MKHTPGPWRWFRNIHCAGPLKGAYVDAQGDVPARIADVLSHGGVGSQEACEANAFLISKAPAMYLALKEIAKGEGDFDRDPLEHAKNTIDSMRQIAKDMVRMIEDENEA